MTRGEFYEAIDSLCVRHGGSMTSGRRTEKRNAMVGGRPHSAHLRGFAVDVVLDDMSRASKLGFMLEAQELGLMALDETDHIHVQRPVGVQA